MIETIGWSSSDTSRNNIWKNCIGRTFAEKWIVWSIDKVEIYKFFSKEILTILFFLENQSVETTFTQISTWSKLLICSLKSKYFCHWYYAKPIFTAILGPLNMCQEKRIKMWNFNRELPGSLIKNFSMWISLINISASRKICCNSCA